MILPNITGGFLLHTMLYLSNQTNETADPFYEIAAGGDGGRNDVRCYGVYGCFPLESPWTTDTRQISTHPQRPSEIQVKFPVFNKRTRDLPRFIDINDPDGVKNVGINPEGEIFVITHGFTEAGDRPWVRDMTAALLENDDEGTSSVIIVDWGGGSNPPYAQAVANIRLVGAIAAHMLYLVYEELGLKNLDNVHMIGHSLGAHLSGYTGYTVQRDFGLKLGRISGLDPAEPLFTDTDPLVRLDYSDATFVDVVHTDASPLIKGGLGMRKPIGHVDFYPNGGYDNPGCDLGLHEYVNREQGSVVLGLRQFLGCNHIRSFQYFIESIQSNCPFTAITCDSYENFQAGNCFECGKDGHQCLQFGYYSYNSFRYLVENGAIVDQIPVVAYFMTNRRAPYCRAHYRVTIKISSSDESVLHGGEIGTMSFRIHSQNKMGVEDVPFSNEPIYFEPGFQYTAVVPGIDIGPPKYITASWDYQTNILNPLTWRILSSPRVYVEYIEIESMEHKSKVRLCPVLGTPVISGNQNVLKSEYCPNS